MERTIPPTPSSTSSSLEPILVIGAGVLGLSTATRLQAQNPARRVTIIASELPTDPSPTPGYASPWAGAHYRPIPGSSPQLTFEAALAKRTFVVMKQIAAEAPEAGVECMLGTEYLENPPDANLALRSGDEVAGPGDGFRVLGPEELPANAKWGCEYGTYCINVPVYCRWLMNKFVESGGKVVSQRLKNAEAAFELAEQNGLEGEELTTVVNCSGTNFGSDPALRIIRGQTVLVKQQYGKTVTRQNKDGSWAFLIPRPGSGGTIVGGSKEIGDMEERPRPETREKLLQQAVTYFPDFVKEITEFQIIRDNVGMRPAREGGVRLEIEALEGGRKRIIHAYGIGGRGYETSWAIAEKAVELVSTES